MKALLILIALLTLAGCGESECQKGARLTADSVCENGGWRKTVPPSDSESQCMKDVQAKFLQECAKAD